MAPGCQRWRCTALQPEPEPLHRHPGRNNTAMISGSSLCHHPPSTTHLIPPSCTLQPRQGYRGLSVEDRLDASLIYWSSHLVTVLTRVFKLPPSSSHPPLPPSGFWSFSSNFWSTNSNKTLLLLPRLWIFSFLECSVQASLIVSPSSHLFTNHSLRLFPDKQRPPPSPSI